MHRIYHLSVAARPQTESDYGSRIQIESENLFFDACADAMPEVFGEEYLDGLADAKLNTVEMIDDALTTLLAHDFSDRLRSELGKETVAMIVARNNVREDDTCASHDFCDPNMLMLDAFTAYGIPAPSSLQDGTAEHEASCRLWNKAWAAAKVRAFRPSTQSGA